MFADMKRVFYHSSHVRYTMILPIDGVASFSYYLEETLDHANNCVWLHFLPATLCQETTIWILHIAFNDGGNRTRAACSASECAIHCAIASRKPIWSVLPRSPKTTIDFSQQDRLWFHLWKCLLRDLNSVKRCFVESSSWCWSSSNRYFEYLKRSD